jgi:hypothetical protein
MDNGTTATQKRVGRKRADDVRHIKENPKERGPHGDSGNGTKQNATGKHDQVSREDQPCGKHCNA